MVGVLACSLAGGGGISPPPVTPTPPVTPPPVTPPPVTPPPVTPPPPPTNPGVSFSGTVMAGSLPIVGAAIQLYAAGTGGSCSASTALLTSALTTDATGTFPVAAGYSCPAAASEIYVVARGGE